MWAFRDLIHHIPPAVGMIMLFGAGAVFGVYLGELMVRAMVHNIIDEHFARGWPNKEVLHAEIDGVPWSKDGQRTKDSSTAQ